MMWDFALMNLYSRLMCFIILRVSLIMLSYYWRMPKPLLLHSSEEYIAIINDYSLLSFTITIEHGMGGAIIKSPWTCEGIGALDEHGGGWKFRGPRITGLRPWWGLTCRRSFGRLLRDALWSERSIRCGIAWWISCHWWIRRISTSMSCYGRAGRNPWAWWLRNLHGTGWERVLECWRFHSRKDTVSTTPNRIKWSQYHLFASISLSFHRSIAIAVDDRNKLQLIWGLYWDDMPRGCYWGHSWWWLEDHR